MNENGTRMMQGCLVGAGLVPALLWATTPCFGRPRPALGDHALLWATTRVRPYIP
ncbi:MAG: hypothetical protein H6667_09990 [Ardenticatenaceae bacterium]|nr:hypothetical protein [Ardenticatenaceae bacterium]